MSAMTMQEGVMWLQSHKGYLMIRPGGRPVALNNAQKLIWPMKPQDTYCRFDTSDIMAVDWTVHTPAQIVELAERLRAEAGE